MTQYGGPPGPPGPPGPGWPAPTPAPGSRRNWWLIGSAAGVVLVLLATLAVVAGVLVIRRLRDTPAPAVAGHRCTYPRSAVGTVPRKANLPPVSGVAASGRVGVRLDTGQGRLTMTLDRAKAPCTVNSFVSLVGQRYFDGTPCHRLTTASIYVLQCGDPSGTGTGGPGYNIPDENLQPGDSAPITYPAGTIAMANAGPDTNGSQFFIVYRDTPLPPNYPIFGTLTGGLDVVQRIAVTGSDPAGDGRPKTTVTLESARLTR
jgi:peptidyl-prolyl cis-trans isomerase B (cyclophilin B)